ncbi:putative 6-phosphofructo-2-kinase/fructose-2-6-bisphosphatase [Venturia nashicola]|uniref:Putative 6-phosphofructo-2-kinase/fructose-2-6-bisphosphatase n=1 Tax=Venturia nashicola TaxID=86259 RepID=A0A4Z1PRJ7_9PEZI|nr:putative 6-phosphofructo-2-kinase/fructose-2-6-bisphosphatase [Venturia nashicola]
MLFTSILPFALVATTSAGVIRRSEQSTNEVTGVLQVLDRINAGMSKIDQDIKLWTGDRPGGEVIMEDGRQIISDLSVGAKFIEHATNIGTVESLQLLGPIESLNSLTEVLATELVRRKNMIDRLELVPQTVTLLEHARHSALDISREMTLKLPVTTSWAASPLTNTVVQKLDNAIKTFGGGRGQLGSAPNGSPQPSNPFESQPLPWAGQGQSQPQPEPNQPLQTPPQGAQPWSSQPQPEQPDYPQQQPQGQDQPNPVYGQGQDQGYPSSQQGQDQGFPSSQQGQEQGFPSSQQGQDQKAKGRPAKPKNTGGSGPQ